MGELRSAVVFTEGDAPPTYTCVLPREKASAPLARHLLAEVLTEWRLPGLVDDAGLVLGELVANAADHARGEKIRITIVRTDEALVRLSVVDLDRKRPQLVAAGPADEGGRGLRLIEALSESWGVDPFTWGKSVWADMVAGGSL